ncbi:polysaccharide biosynthesis/export family protein [Qipengyuania aquimaris]|uniref:polysaccharide biosynthesis/export family protein n=1 Tax=Qipengyuania aquimaris TaxID=255984 RepID=UPI001FD4FF0F|nr:polysaccharide biosynthesis/export family protein [Qipengyuania aquimaris]UOR14982.1 polysaccharide export protein [Qipengyuania aquimaris]
MIRKFHLVALALATAACSGGVPELGQAPGIDYVEAEAMPEPTNRDGQYVYALGVLDKIDFEIVGLPDMSRQLTVDGQGFVSIPIAGYVSAAGLTPSELATEIESRLKDAYVRNPQVLVNLVEANSNVVTLEGQVKQPGLYPVRSATTLSQAIAAAGGEDDLARISIVILQRKVNGEEYIGLYDLRGIRYGNYADPMIYPGDKIVVDESRSRRTLDTFQGVTNLLTTPLIILSRQL